MIPKSAFCVLIPAFNEENNIARVVSEVLSLGYAVVVVDDGSTDDTCEIVSALAVPCLTSSVNEGKGSAIQRGFDWFLKERFEALIIMDADGQHRTEELERFTAAIQDGRGDLIVGNRMTNPVGMSWIRILTNRTMSSMISAAAKQRISDTQCGYRALTKQAVAKIELSTKHFEVESEMLLRASGAGLRIASIPIESVYHDEISRIRPAQDTLRFFKFFIRFLFCRKL